MDVTGSHTLFGDNLTIAKRIQKEVWSTYGIYVTIGIGPNPLMADIEAKHTASGIAENGRTKMYRKYSLFLRYKRCGELVVKQQISYVY